MGYVKHEWKAGDIVASAKLNEMEDGIFNAQEKITESAKLSADLLLEGINNKLVSQAEKTSWDGKSVVSIPAESTSTNEAKFIKVNGTDYKLASGEGKVWKALTLTPANLNTLIAGGEVVGDLDPEYDPGEEISKFKNDYFVCNVQQKAYEDARSIWAMEELGKVYVNTVGFNDSIAYIANSVVNAVKERGFDYNYYKTIVLYSSNVRETGKTRILDSVNLLNATNVIYLQDVSQQGWEYNYGDPKYIEKMRREQLYSTELGKAFAISIRGKDNTTANCATFVYCMKSSQTSYLDESDGEVKWANIEAGEVYPVHFDPDTLRWMLDAVYKPTGSEEFYGVAMTNERKAALLSTGIEFSKETAEGEQKPWIASAGLSSKMDKIDTECLGVGINALTNIFSFNSQFGAEYVDTIRYLGRPIAHVSDTFTYTKESETRIEKNGYYVWAADVDGIQVLLTIPDNYDDEGVPHRDTYVVRINFSTLYDTESIFRHTFTIKTPNILDIGRWELNLAMCAVNPDQADDTMEYLLHSDESGQEFDWILPVSGTIGRVVGYNYKGDVIYANKINKVVTLTSAYDLAKFEDLWETLPKQRDNKYYIFYGTDPDQSRLINMRIEKEDVDHAFDLYVYDDYDGGKPYIRFVTQAIGEVQKGFYMWDTSTHS